LQKSKHFEGQIKNAGKESIHEFRSFFESFPKVLEEVKNAE
jgi:hypothetical protein